MKTTLLTFLMFTAFLARAQQTEVIIMAWDYDNPDNSMKGLSVSANPLGLLQLGPIINAEFGVSDHLVINSHVRFPGLGLLTPSLMYDDGKPHTVSGIAFGGGLIYFFGEQLSKPYLGVLCELHHANASYSDYSGNWSNSEESFVLALNGGYRFRFPKGFYLNTGAYIGSATGTNRWLDFSSGNFDYGAEEIQTVFAMLDLSIGIQF